MRFRQRPATHLAPAIKARTSGRLWPFTRGCTPETVVPERRRLKLLISLGVMPREGGKPPDKETGIGGWTDEQIAAAITTGKRPDGRQLAPIMNYAAFTYMTKEDVAAVVAYLRSIPPVKNEVPGPFKPGEKVSIFTFRILPPGEIAAQAPK